MAMKKSILYFLILMVFVACGGGDDTGETPHMSKDNIRANVTALNLSSDGDARDINVTANCSWQIAIDVQWLETDIKNGSNSQKVSVRASKNTTGQERTGTITITGGSPLITVTITVTQGKLSDSEEQPRMSVDKSSLEFEKDGGNQSFIITSNTNWTITCPDWCTLSTKTGNGNATITVTATKNDKTEQRTGQVVISGDGVNDVNINVTQKPADDTPNEPSPGDNLPPS
jgi:hypothetical protein